MRINEDYNNTLYSDENGNPIVFYHSYEGEDDLDAEMIWLSTDEEFSKEFGDNTDEYYLFITHPYVTKEDGVLRDENGDEIIYEDEPAGIGFLDAIPERKLLWFM